MSTILNLHNQLRQRVAAGQEYRGASGAQPAARRMPNLVIFNIHLIRSNTCMENLTYVLFKLYRHTYNAYVTH